MDDSEHAQQKRRLLIIVQINLARKNSVIIFAICCLLTLAIPAVAPKYRLMFFAPFLVIVCYQQPLRKAIWAGIGCGFIFDLLSPHTRLGLHALDFCVATALIYPQKRHFFADSLSTLPIMTFLFSVISTALLAVMLYVIEMQNVFSLAWVATDLLFLPIADAAFAFLAFILPSFLFGQRPRRGSDYFMPD